MMRTAIVLAGLCLMMLKPARADEFTAKELNLYAGTGASLSNRHGRSTFHSVTFELMSDSKHLVRWLPNSDAGLSLSYSDVLQPRSWFGNDGDPNDHVRSEWLFAFARYHFLRLRSSEMFVELGTGPMWGNRRIPAATSRFNFHSQFGVGTVLFRESSHPLRLIGHFSHASNAGTASRNPGLNIFSWSVGTTVGRRRP